MKTPHAILLLCLALALTIRVEDASLFLDNQGFEVRYQAGWLVVELGEAPCGGKFILRDQSGKVVLSLEAERAQTRFRLPLGKGLYRWRYSTSDRLFEGWFYVEPAPRRSPIRSLFS